VSQQHHIGITIPFPEVVAIKAFLGYLNKNYSKLINPNDNFLIAAIAAWFHQESGGYRSVIGNNPFNIRPGMLSFMSNGYRVARGGNGRFLTFSSLSVGFEAAAYLLIHGSTAYGYRTAVNALKQGGNQGAVDFLAAMAMSHWDAGRYGTDGTFATVFNPKRNHLLRGYASITGLQLSDPHPQVKKRKPPPPIKLLERSFNYNVVVRNYLDPWKAKDMYLRRHKPSNVDGLMRKR
jgi:hypothetical protein